MSYKIEKKSKEYKKKKYNKINGNNFDDSPILLPKTFIKNDKNVISLHTSELSTLNTMTNSPNTLKHSNKKTNIVKNKNSDTGEIICQNINKVFLALEQLIIDDNNNEKKLNNNNNCSSSFSSNKDSYDKNSKKNMKTIINKQSKSIKIPKLNFTDISDYYKKTPIKIKVIKFGKPENNMSFEKSIYFSKLNKKQHNE